MLMKVEEEMYPVVFRSVSWPGVFWPSSGDCQDIVGGAFEGSVVQDAAAGVSPQEFGTGNVGTCTGFLERIDRAVADCSPLVGQQHGR